MKPKQIPGIPLQKSGGFHDTESQKEYDDPAIMAQKFDVLKNRFFSINQWKEYCGKGSADFILHDSYGNQIESAPKKGDLIRIDIPGPGESEAKGFDWVEIVNISHQRTNTSESFIMTCKPSQDPSNDKNNHIAHFYSGKSTSTFMISKDDKYLKAAIYGRNETPNLNARFLDKIRNLLIAIGGIMGISKIQWKCLSDGLLNF